LSTCADVFCSSFAHFAEYCEENAFADSSTIKDICLDSYLGSQKARTTLVVNTTMRFRGFTIDDLQKDTAAQLTIRAVIAAILGVSIDQVTLILPSGSSTANIYNGILDTESATISAIINYILEEKGYSQLDKNAAFASIVSEFIAAVQNGRFMAMIRKESEQTYETDLFSDGANIESVEITIVPSENKGNDSFFEKYEVEVIISASVLGATLLAIGAVLFWQRRKALIEESDKKKKADEISARAAEMEANNSYDKAIDFAKDDFSIKILSVSSKEMVKPGVSSKNAQERDSILSALYGRPMNSSKVHVSADETIPDGKLPTNTLSPGSFKAEDHTIYVTSQETHEIEPMDEPTEFFNFGDDRSSAWNSPLDISKSFSPDSQSEKSSWAFGRFADRVDAFASPEAESISHLSVSDSDGISVSSRRVVLPPISSNIRNNQTDLRIDPFTPQSTVGSIANGNQSDASPPTIRVRNRARRGGGPKSKKSSPKNKWGSAGSGQPGDAAEGFQRPLARPSPILPPVQMSRNRIAVRDTDSDIETGLRRGFGDEENDDSSIEI
jgi:hypothetical protein